MGVVDLAPPLLQANSLAIKHVKDEEYSVYAFYTETTPPSLQPMSIDNSLSNNNGYIPLPESGMSSVGHTHLIFTHRCNGD